jgi:hypothetical protein
LTAPPAEAKISAGAIARKLSAAPGILMDKATASAQIQVKAQSTAPTAKKSRRAEKYTHRAPSASPVALLFETRMDTATGRPALETVKSSV